MKVLLAICLIAVSAARADAACIHHGILYAKTSIAQEYAESRWVVRARVVSADYHWSDEGESWTLYRLRVVQSYKGKLQQHFTFLTERNSGGFYMDGDGAVPDLADYLLFLIPEGWSKSGRPAARDALWVNYNCGQSKRWSEVTSGEVAWLNALSKGR